jgi:hypothetical protein
MVVALLVLELSAGYLKVDVLEVPVWVLLVVLPVVALIALLLLVFELIVE